MYLFCHEKALPESWLNGYTLMDRYYLRLTISEPNSPQRFTKSNFLQRRELWLSHDEWQAGLLNLFHFCLQKKDIYHPKNVRYKRHFKNKVSKFEIKNFKESCQQGSGVLSMMYKTSIKPRSTKQNEQVNLKEKQEQILFD